MGRLIYSKTSEIFALFCGEFMIIDYMVYIYMKSGGPSIGKIYLIFVRKLNGP